MRVVLLADSKIIGAVHDRVLLDELEHLLLDGLNLVAGQTGVAESLLVGHIDVDAGLVVEDVGRLLRQPVRMLLRDTLEDESAVLVEEIKLLALKSLHDLGFNGSTCGESFFDIGAELLTNLLDGSVYQLVLYTDEDLEERTVGPLESELTAHSDITFLDFLVEHSIVELSGILIGELVRQLTALRLDDDRLSRRNTVDLRVLASVETLRNTLLMLSQGVDLVDEVLSRRLVLLHWLGTVHSIHN